MSRQFLPRKCEYTYRTRVGQGKGKWVRVCVLKMAFPALNLGLRPVPSGVTRYRTAVHFSNTRSVASIGAFGAPHPRNANDAVKRPNVALE